MKTFTVNENDAEQRLDKFVLKTTKGMPTSLLYKFIRKKRVKVNGKRCEPSQRLSVGDTVGMYIPDEFFGTGTGAGEYSRSSVRLDVVYEDDNLILVNKAPGVPSHTGDGEGAAPSGEAERATLIFSVKAYLAAKGEYDPRSENSFAPALCNRIDRNTSGLVIAAKNARTLRAVNAAIRDREIKKYYLCAVHGIPEKESDTLTAYLKKDEKTRKVDVADAPRGQGYKKIVTAYRVLKKDRARDIALCEVELLTGRTHQIRAHFDHVNRDDKKIGFRYQALCSYKTVFRSEKDELSYLYGKSFSIPADADRIPFLSLFGDNNN